MEELNKHIIEDLRHGRPVSYTVTEKDHGDEVVYDVFSDEAYLFTASPKGEILFMNFEASEEDKELFRNSFFDQFLRKLKNKEQEA